MYAWTSYRRVKKYAERGFGTLLPVAQQATSRRGWRGEWMLEPWGTVDYNRFLRVFEYGAMPPHMAAQMQLVMTAVLQANARVSAADWLGTSDFVYPVGQ
ncbi:hypothetical protein GPECTOR_2131g1112 [Gonium pectorale]|uniref:Uncharacterized protein n=1 Tax=Gonium pectorale TaxID=33097 RepID=A0A150FT84_GONPE|nr:hypothetical protein GPECTOR_2131g1112 [Gonium pectorale]|eukprot:KXZ40819.1 hypothetical protein GPECTOR_2131g1112 [Gonium pectorale]